MMMTGEACVIRLRQDSSAGEDRLTLCCETCGEDLGVVNSARLRAITQQEHLAWCEERIQGHVAERKRASASV